MTIQAQSHQLPDYIINGVATYNVDDTNTLVFTMVTKSWTGYFTTYNETTQDWDIEEPIDPTLCAQMAKTLELLVPAIV